MTGTRIGIPAMKEDGQSGARLQEAFARHEQTVPNH